MNQEDWWTFEFSRQFCVSTGGPRNSFEFYQMPLLQIGAAIMDTERMIPTSRYVNSDIFLNDVEKLYKNCIFSLKKLQLEMLTFIFFYSFHHWKTTSNPTFLVNIWARKIVILLFTFLCQMFVYLLIFEIPPQVLSKWIQSRFWTKWTNLSQYISHDFKSFTK